jgi:hypothetical protein
MGAKKVFISYSRRNKAFVDRITADLITASFDLWRDSDSLIPGTPSWEKAIREAIKAATAVVLVASPNALESNYVQGELALAKIYNRPIYPIWADGNEWIECVPLDMVNYQYVDGRGENYIKGIVDLVTTLSKIFDVSEGTIKLGLPTHEVVELNLAQFETGFNILNHIWLNHLQDWYEVFSYGREWVIANVATKQIALPWQWLKMKSDDPNNILQLNTLAGSSSYEEFGILPGSYWAVWDARRLKANALFLNDDNLMRTLLSANGFDELKSQLSYGRIQYRKLAEVVPSFFRHKIVIAALDKSSDRDVIVEV